MSTPDYFQLDEESVEQVLLAANNGHPQDDDNPIIFETLRSFLERDVPQSESLIGVARDGTNLLPRYMAGSCRGAKKDPGKTSVLVDLMFHACAGIDWLQYPIGHALKMVAVVNEGVPGGLQDKLRQKTERWEQDDSVLDNLAVYASPWGEFTFANERMVNHARDFCRDFQADYIALDPLHTPRHNRSRIASRNGSVQAHAARLRTVGLDRDYHRSPQQQSRDAIRRLGTPPRHRHPARKGRTEPGDQVHHSQGAAS